MKKILTCLFIINLVIAFGQQDSIKIPEEKSKIQLGVDLFSPVYGLLTDKQGLEFMGILPIYNKWSIATEVGMGKSKFNQLGWKSEQNGVYGKIGVNRFINQDIKNHNIGYYLGVRVAYANYQQTVGQFLIQGSGIENETGSLPKHSGNLVWLEPLAGGSIRIWDTPFYINASARLKIGLYHKNELETSPLAVPGFGDYSSGLNIGVNWSLVYVLPF